MGGEGGEDRPIDRPTLWTTFKYLVGLLFDQFWPSDLFSVRVGRIGSFFSSGRPTRIFFQFESADSNFVSVRVGRRRGGRIEIPVAMCLAS